MNDAPWPWLTGGPNGGGKITYAPSLAVRVEEIVRPDDFIARLNRIKQLCREMRARVYR